MPEPGGRAVLTPESRVFLGRSPFPSCQDPLLSSEVLAQHTLCQALFALSQWDP